MRATVFVLLLLCLIQLCGEAKGVSLFRNSPDLYKDLGLSKKATRSEIKKAFRKLTMENHPDLKETVEEKEMAKLKMLQILKAYEILSNDELREEYDKYGKVEMQSFMSESFENPSDLYSHVHMRAPIISKSRVIESEKELNRIFSFRGQKIFLVQIYADDVQSCRDFSPIWEEVGRHNLVTSGLVEMLRIDAFSTSGKVLAKKVHLSLGYTTPPPLFVVVDGRQWNFNYQGLKKSNYEVSQTIKAHEIISFLQRFFYEHFANQKKEVVVVSELLQYLQSNFSQEVAARVFLYSSDINSDLINVYRTRFPLVEVIAASQSVLLDFIEGYCNNIVEIKDRFGTAVSPDLVLAIRKPVKILNVDRRASDNGLESPCSNIRIAGSSHLTFSKLNDFTLELLEIDSQLSKVPQINDFQFYNVCKQDCLLYFLPDCPKQSSGTAMSNTNEFHILMRDYFLVQTGYVCLSQHPKLIDELNVVVNATLINLSEPFFALVVNADDKKLFPILAGSPLRQNMPNLPPTVIDAAIAQLLLETSSGGEEGEQNQGNTPFDLLTLELALGVSSLLETSGFPMSFLRKATLLFQDGVQTTWPYTQKLVPFIFMFLAHKIAQFSRRR